MATRPAKPLRLLDQVRNVLRAEHYSIRTEQAYVDRVRRFTLFHDKRRPRPLLENKIAQFLTHLAATRRVAASTHNQALSALVFLYRHELDDPLGDIIRAVRAKRPGRPDRMPVLLKRAEVAASLREPYGVHWLVA